MTLLLHKRVFNRKQYIKAARDLQIAGRRAADSISGNGKTKSEKESGRVKRMRGATFLAFEIMVLAEFKSIPS